MINTELTKREKEIMQILWNSKQPMLASEIHSKTVDIAEKSMHYLINSLINKGFIKVVGSIITVKVPSRLYAPAISVTDYATLLMNETLRSNHMRFNFNDFILCLTKNNKKRNDELVKQMKEYIENYENSGDE
ncbi:MAG: BlaI/MecI/CopY family transcriptional regulator [Eubacterium sp.]|nr:BlaI/MecI/CopY family transcriptional regulator [Eubacterium sp.]